MNEINEPQDNKQMFKAFIRVVKSIALNDYSCGFDTVEVLREPLILAKDKAEVKKILLEKYPQFFQNGKIYEKETKDQAQFFYVIKTKCANFISRIIHLMKIIFIKCQ